MLTFLKTIKTKLSRYIDVGYFVRFFILILCFYYANIFYISITDKNGMIYNAFLEDNLNYVAWLRNSILYSSNILARLTGLDSYVDLPYHLRTSNGTYIETVYSCLGIGLMSFWMAFVIADKQSVKNKFLWCITGIFSIWVINVLRITVLLAAYERQWKVNALLDHHTLFNIFAYSLLIYLVCLYLKKSKKVISRRDTLRLQPAAHLGAQEK